MSWKKNVGYYILGVASSAIASFAYVDYRFQKAEEKYQQQIDLKAEEMRIEIRNAGGQISFELEDKIDKEILNFKKQLGLVPKKE
ncbi:MAG: hypothetical protein Q8O88_00945 [bacterium]|nr:hypothetical protein [bacterium]